MRSSPKSKKRRPHHSGRADLPCLCDFALDVDTAPGDVACHRHTRRRRTSLQSSTQTLADQPGAAATSPGLTIVAATLVGLPLGSIYAFSVFLKPLEALLGVSRSELSFVFGLATVFYTVGANIAPILFGRLSATVLLLLCSTISASGMLLAANATNIVALGLGYGVLFGIGGGMAFCIVQQCVNLLSRGSQGLINGYLVALFPLGAMLATPLFGWGVATAGVRTTLGCVSVMLATSGLLGLVLVRRSGVRLADAAAHGPSSRFVLTNKASFWKVFVVFLLAAAAGLTVLSQAAAIVLAYGGSTAVALAATTGITAAIASARIGGGWLVDRYAIPHVAVGAQIISLGGAVLLTVIPSVAACVVAIMMIGIGYGLISGVVAGATAAYWERSAYSRIASRIYVAWCIAAVSLPIVAARLYDLTAGYRAAFVIAGGCSFLAIAISMTLPRRGAANPVMAPAA